MLSVDPGRPGRAAASSPARSTVAGLADTDRQRQRRQRHAARRLRRVRGHARPRRLPRRRGQGRGRQGDHRHARQAGADRQGARQGRARGPPHPRVHPARARSGSPTSSACPDGSTRCGPTRSRSRRRTSPATRSTTTSTASVDYRVKLQPNDTRDHARPPTPTSRSTLDNTAPADGPAADRDRSVHCRIGSSPARTGRCSRCTHRCSSCAATVDGKPDVGRAGSRARAQRVLAARSRSRRRRRRRPTTQLAGPVQLHDGWYTLQVRAQPTLNPDQRARVGRGAGGLEDRQGARAWRWRSRAAPVVDRPT